MGRAGRGGGGGGGFRSSGFGGSRGFGSHSGGSSSHRSSFSSSSHSSHSYHHSNYHSSYHSRYNSGPRFYYFGGSRYRNGYSGGYSASPTSGCTRGFINIVVWIVIGIIVIAALAIGSDSKASGGVTKSTVNREKLQSSSLVESDQYFCDELDWISDPVTLRSGMEHFYEKTGVQPFLYITDNVGGSPTDDRLEAFGNEVYDKYFSDEAHLVVLFYEKSGSYRSCYIAGKEAKTVVDDEAGEILLDYIDHYYYSDFDEATFFSKSFYEAADRMMRITPSYGWIAGIFVLVLAIVIVLFVWWKKKKKHKLDEMKQAQDILNSDLNEFSAPGYEGSEASSEVEELKKKYDN